MAKSILIRTLFLLGCVAPVRGQCLDFSNDFAPANAGPNAVVHALTTYDDGTGTALYAGGDFTLAGGLQAKGVARWNGSGWSPLGSGTSSSVSSLAVFDDGAGPKLYVGGVFNFAGGVATGPIACWDGISWSAVGGGIPLGAVNALCVHDDGSGPALYAGGSFDQAGFGPAANIARYQNGVWSALGLGTGPGINAIASFDSGSGPALYVGGGFSTAGGVSAGRIARWQNHNWFTLQGGISGGVTSLKVFSDGGTDKLFVGGNFSFVNGAACQNVARWSGTAWQSCSIALTRNGPVRAFEIHDDGSGNALYATGEFTMSGIPAPEGHIARWNGTSWVSLSTGLSKSQGENPGQALLSSNFLGVPRLFVGGSFNKAGGKASSNVAVWGDACSAPIVLTHPQSKTAAFGTATVFSTTAVGTAPVTYQWRRNQVALVDDAHMLGATTPTLSLWYYTYQDLGEYDCVISNGIGSVTCNPAHLAIPLGGTSGIPLHLRKVVFPPEPVSSLPAGNTFQLAAPPLQCSTGEILSVTTISGQPALVLFDHTTPRVLIKGLDAAPLLGPGVTFPGQNSPLHAFNFYVPAANGQAAVSGDLEGWAVTLETRKVIWHFHSNGVDVVVREGDQAVGFPTGQVHRFPSAPVISDTGRVAFRSHVFSGSQSTGVSLWAWDSGIGRQLLAKAGDVAPGSTAHFTGINQDPKISRFGTVVFQADLDSVTGIHNFTTSDSGLYAGVPGSLQRVASSGDPAPGMPVGSNMESFGKFEAEDSGSVVFVTLVAYPTGGGKWATYRWASGVLSLLSAYGDALPDVDPSSVVFQATPWESSVSGAIVLDVSLQISCQPPCPSRGLWLKSANGYQTIAMNGDYPYPDLPAGLAWAEFKSVAMNDQDQVVFEMRVYSGESYSAVYGWSMATGLFPLAVPGGQVDLANHDYRTIQSAVLSDSVGPGFGTEGTDIDSAGRTSLRITFTDATSGIFETNFNAVASVYGNTGHKFCFGDGSGSACPCGNPGLPGQGCANSTGVGAELIGMGSVSVLDDDLRFLTSNLPPNKPGLLLQGGSVAAGGAGTPLDSGLLCVGAPIRRIAPGVSSPVGQMTFGPGLAASGLWAGGQTRYFQTWYRNPTGPCGSASNLSNGFQVDLVP